MATKKPKGLGRGLDTLLGADAAIIGTLGQSGGPADTSLPTTLSIKAVKPGKYQPRSRMDEGTLEELAQSIRTQGVIQPILVRPLAKNGKYEIIAGERRYRAAQIAGLDEIPVLVREVADENAAVIALIENIQREDLNPLEEAQGVKRLLDEFGLTHEQASQAIGRSRSATSNILRLLNLTEPVQTMLLAGDIDMGHARALLAVDTAAQILLANEIIARRLSVRETEKLIQRHLNDAAPVARGRDAGSKNASGDVQRLEQSLSDLLGTQVSLKLGKASRGQLKIDFHDWQHLNTLLEQLNLNSVLDS